MLQDQKNKITINIKNKKTTPQRTQTQASHHSTDKYPFIDTITAKAILNIPLEQFQDFMKSQGFVQKGIEDQPYCRIIVNGQEVDCPYAWKSKDSPLINTCDFCVQCENEEEDVPFLRFSTAEDDHAAKISAFYNLWAIFDMPLHTIIDWITSRQMTR